MTCGIGLPHRSMAQKMSAASGIISAENREARCCVAAMLAASRAVKLARKTILGVVAGMFRAVLRRDRNWD